MKLSPRVREILDRYEGETAGTKANLARILMAGPSWRHWPHGYFAGRSRL